MFKLLVLAGGQVPLTGGLILLYSSAYEPLACATPLSLGYAPLGSSRSQHKSSAALADSCMLAITSTTRCSHLRDLVSGEAATPAKYHEDQRMCRRDRQSCM